MITPALFAPAAKSSRRQRRGLHQLLDRLPDIGGLQHRRAGDLDRRLRRRPAAQPLVEPAARIVAQHPDEGRPAAASARCAAAARISRRPTPRSRQSSSTYSVSISPSAGGAVQRPLARRAPVAKPTIARRRCPARDDRRRRRSRRYTPVPRADRALVIRRLPRHRQPRQEPVRQDAGIGAAPRRDMHRADRDGIGRPGAADRDHAARSSTAAKNPSVPCRARRQRQERRRGRAAAPAASRRAPAAPARSPDGGEEALHLRLVLLGEQRAGSVDQTTAAANQPRGLVQDRRLLDHAAPPGRAPISRSRASGLRRQVPMPVQGASTSTRSKPPARRLAHLSPGSTRWRSTLCTPARRSRRTAPSSRAADTSQAAIWPRFSIVIASASVLPPAPAHQSATRMPGRASISAATSWLPSSWISTRPCWNVRPAGHRPAPRRSAAPRARAASASPATPSAASDARACLARRLQQIDAQVERRRLAPAPPVRRRAMRRSGPPATAAASPALPAAPHRACRDGRACGPPAGAARRARAVQRGRRRTGRRRTTAPRRPASSPPSAAMAATSRRGVAWRLGRPATSQPAARAQHAPDALGDGAPVAEPPMNRRARKKSLATASAGRRGSVSIASSNSIAAARRAAGVTARCAGSAAEVRQLGDAAAQAIFVRLAAAVDPEHAEAEAQRAERVPGVRRNERQPLRRQCEPLGGQPVDTRIRLEYADRLDTQHIVQQVGDAGRPHARRPACRRRRWTGSRARSRVAQRRQHRPGPRDTRPAGDTPPARRASSAASVMPWRAATNASASSVNAPEIAMMRRAGEAAHPGVFDLLGAPIGDSCAASPARGAARAGPSPRGRPAACRRRRRPRRRITASAPGGSSAPRA